MLRAFPPLLAAAALLGLSPSARAEDGGVPTSCEDEVQRGPRFVTPASGASEVTLDAWVKLDYSAGYFAEGFTASVELRHCGEELTAVECETLGEPVEGEAQVVGGETLFFVPAEPLEPRTLYAGVATGIDQDLGFSFRTGATLDTEPPHLPARLDTPSTGRTEGDARCGVPAGFRVSVSFDPREGRGRVDDGPEGSVEYLLYLTRGATVRAPELRARTRFFPTSLLTMAFVLEPEEAVAPVCVVVHAVDGVGNVNRSMEPACFEPVQGNFFEPICAAGGAPGRMGAGDGGGGLAVLGLALGAMLWRRRRATR